MLTAPIWWWLKSSLIFHCHSWIPPFCTLWVQFTLSVRCARLKGLVIFVLLRTKVSWDRTRFISFPSRTRQECFSAMSYYAECFFFLRRTQKCQQHVVDEFSSLVSLIIEENYVSQENVGTEINRTRKLLMRIMPICLIIGWFLQRELHYRICRNKAYEIMQNKIRLFKEKYAENSSGDNGNCSRNVIAHSNCENFHQKQREI